MMLPKKTNVPGRVNQSMNCGTSFVTVALNEKDTTLQTEQPIGLMSVGKLSA